MLLGLTATRECGKLAATERTREVEMKLFGKKLDKVPDQRKIEEMEIELGLTPIVTEENFEREFDRALINDYRERFEKSWIEAEAYISRYYARHKYYRDDNEERARKRWNEKVSETARKAFEETLALLIQESSQEEFQKEFDPNHKDNYRSYHSYY
ncbi:hypothetical protein SEA_ANNADREAMY_247 [Streptomyces phage Annadreamy]|uniref:Uncharacterized protein n=2 Tax=Annadreamyvirus annadreamy TaxID=2846392 RepID=A0A345GTQ4_9CAUD|nr:hypothetical protein HWB75_gp032 [Streptomyces phage Annadreamy]AXG66326.1 hypothetical protein SEA_ANNADREAMY_247 [Streptomyces phage Annadreamy]QGH79554.1 hypothetical protein SEA_LIMPID_253 [Streptomyces phage Limpid]